MRDNCCRSDWGEAFKPFGASRHQSYKYQAYGRSGVKTVSENDSTNNSGISELELARRVRALDNTMEPERDLWAGIQRQILDHPQKTPVNSTHRWMPHAVAASLLVAVTALALNIVQMQGGNEYRGEPVVLQQMQREYMQVRNPMVEEFSRVNQGLDEPTRQELYRNLEIMTQARRDLEVQLKENPEDVHLIEMLMKVHEQEIELLRQDFTAHSRSL